MTFRSFCLSVAILLHCHIILVFSSEAEVVPYFTRGVPSFVEVLPKNISDPMRYLSGPFKALYTSSNLDGGMGAQFIENLRSYRHLISHSESIMSQMVALISLFEQPIIIEQTLEILNPCTESEILLSLRTLLENQSGYDCFRRYCTTNPSTLFYENEGLFNLTALTFAAIQDSYCYHSISCTKKETWNEVLPYKVKVQQTCNGYQLVQSNRTYLDLRTFMMPNFRGYTKEYHSSPLHAAADCSNHRVMGLLLAAGFNPETKDLDGDNALEVAMRPPPLLTKEIEEKNNERIRKGEKPYFRGLEHRKKSRLILKLFLKYSKKIDQGTTPLIIKHILLATPAKEKYEPTNKNQIIAAVAIKLCRGLVSPLLRDGQGNTLLHAAVIANNPYLVELILSHDSQRDLRNAHDASGRTPFDLALAEEKREVIHAMVSHRSIEKLALLEQAIHANSQQGVEIILTQDDNSEGKVGPWGDEIKAMISLALSVGGGFKSLQGFIRAAYYFQKKRHDAARNHCTLKQNPDLQRTNNSNSCLEAANISSATTHANSPSLIGIATFLLRPTGIPALARFATGLLIDSK